MLHEPSLRGHVIEIRPDSAPARLPSHANMACTGNHGVRFVGGMPMLPDMDRFRSANEQTGSVRLLDQHAEKQISGEFSRDRE